MGEECILHLLPALCLYCEVLGVEVPIRSVHFRVTTLHTIFACIIGSTFSW